MEKGKKYPTHFNIKAVGKNIKWGRGRGNWKFCEAKKMGGKKEYQVVENPQHYDADPDKHTRQDPIRHWFI